MSLFKRKNKKNKRFKIPSLLTKKEKAKILAEETYRQKVKRKLSEVKDKSTSSKSSTPFFKKTVGPKGGCLAVIIMFIVVGIIVIIGAGGGKEGTSPDKTLFKVENISQDIKNKLTSGQLEQIVDMLNKSTPEFRQTFALDYAKELAQQNKMVALRLWAKSLGISVSSMDGAWEIYEKIKRTTNDFSLYQDGIKFLEFIITVTDKAAGAEEFLRMLE